MEKNKKRILERRKYVRIPFNGIIKYKEEGVEDAGMETAQCYNINPEGLCLGLKKSLKKGTRLYIEINSEGGLSCSLKGEVLWTAPAAGNGKNVSTGVKITNMSESDKNQFLLELCDKMADKLGKQFPKMKF